LGSAEGFLRSFQAGYAQVLVALLQGKYATLSERRREIFILSRNLAEAVEKKYIDVLPAGLNNALQNYIKRSACSFYGKETL